MQERQGRDEGGRDRNGAAVSPLLSLGRRPFRLTYDTIKFKHCDAEIWYQVVMVSAHLQSDTEFEKNVLSITKTSLPAKSRH